MRYKIWRSGESFADSTYVLIEADPPQGPHGNWEKYVPGPLLRRHQFWVGYKGGLLWRLKPVYRAMLREQGFVVLPGLNEAARLELPPRKHLRLRAGQLKRKETSCQR